MEIIKCLRCKETVTPDNGKCPICGNTGFSSEPMEQEIPQSMLQEEQEAKAALIEAHKHTTICNNEDEENIWEIAYIMGRRSGVSLAIQEKELILDAIGYGFVYNPDIKRWKSPNPQERGVTFTTDYVIKIARSLNTLPSPPSG